MVEELIDAYRGDVAYCMYYSTWLLSWTWRGASYAQPGATTGLPGGGLWVPLQPHLLLLFLLLLFILRLLLGLVQDGPEGGAVAPSVSSNIV